MIPRKACTATVQYKWLYNGGSVNGKPADLGYFVGYAIRKRYYEQATDKRTVSVQSVRAALSNPVKSLRTEQAIPISRRSVKIVALIKTLRT